MARAIDDIANDIRALTADERGELLLSLMAELDVPSVTELQMLVRGLTASATRANRALNVAIARLDTLDETIERGRAEVRQSVQDAEEDWPFPT